MTEPLPAPPVPADADVRGLPYLPLDVVRLLDSDLMALSTGDEFKAAVSLWCRAWNQVPAGSLPDDDRVLAHLSGAGPKWKRVKDMALRGWTMRSDGRLHHDTVGAKAAEAWMHRQSQRARASGRWPGKGREPAPGSSGETRAERMKRARAIATHTEAQWAALVEACGSKCVKCDATGRIEKDHIVPVYAGGSDGIDNLQPLCPRCNASKGPDQKDLRPANWRAAVASATPATADVGQTSGDARRLQGSVKGTLREEERSCADAGAPERVQAREPAATHPALAAVTEVFPDLDRRMQFASLAGTLGIAEAWTRDGADLARDVVPTIRAVCSRMRQSGQGPPSTFAYFAQAVSTARHRNTTPLPPPEKTNAARTSRPSPEDRDRERREGIAAAIAACVADQPGGY